MAESNRNYRILQGRVERLEGIFALRQLSVSSRRTAGRTSLCCCRLLHRERPTAKSTICCNPLNQFLVRASDSDLVPTCRTGLLSLGTARTTWAMAERCKRRIIPSRHVFDAKEVTTRLKSGSYSRQEGRLSTITILGVRGCDVPI